MAILRRRGLVVALWSVAAYLTMVYLAYRWGGLFSYGHRLRFK